MAKETKNATIRLDSATEEALKDYSSINQGVKETIKKLQALQRYADLELRKKLEPAEWSFLADTLNGHIADDSTRYSAEMLVALCEDSERYDGTAQKWSVDINALTSKIRALTSAQVDAVYRRVETFWNTEANLETWANY